ncbi:MAG: phosphonopyruvate decarboxylase [Candidatus Marinimicrobia bacterium]|nr:phosphonopyruvate decarboxylase [Candidatus Neomarinimicrobiota bacterium]
MIQCEQFYNLLLSNNIDFFTGVPDSLLKDFCSFIYDNVEGKKNIIAANEGNAVALAAGYYLATGKYGLVYMQNSGQGNAINPLVSLADIEVYGIPMILLIGWRGEPGKKDEPQHVKQGKITLKLLEVLEIPYSILPEDMEETSEEIKKAVKIIKLNKCPYAFVVRKGTFSQYQSSRNEELSYTLYREEALKLIVDNLDPDDIIVSTTGKISRELFEYRELKRQGHEKEFLTIGSMGHASQIALSIATEKSNRNVYCFDGDGALIMHMGALATVGAISPRNFKHIVFNNGAHDSVGGLQTVAFKINIPEIAKACGYRNVFSAETKKGIIKSLEKLKSIDGPSLLELKINKGARKNLGRPTIAPKQNKIDFMNFLKE